jgi:hypothetical protein
MKTLEFLQTCMGASHLICLELTFIKIKGEEYRPSLHPNVLFSTQFSNTISFCSLRGRDQVSNYYMNTFVCWTAG